jgi:hypothetical protein
MLGQASNPMLAQAEEGILAKVSDNMKDGLQRVVHAGLTIMYSPQLEQQRNERIAATSDPVKEASEGAVRLVLNLYKQSDQKMPTDLVVPASMVFAFEYLDLLAKAGKAQVAPDLIAQATKATGEAALRLMGIGQDKIAQVTAQGQQGGAQPDAAPDQTAAPAAPAGIIAAAQGGA